MTFITETGYGNCVSVSDPCGVPWRISFVKMDERRDLFNYQERRLGPAMDPSGRHRRDVPPRIMARATRAMKRAGYVVVA